MLAPDHNGMSLTPETAERTAAALLQEASTARAQNKARSLNESRKLARKCRELARLAPESLHDELLRMAEEFEGNRKV